MKLKILFNGFRHGHINGLYNNALVSDFVEIAGCIEQNEAARKNAEEKLGASFSDKPYEWWLNSDIDVVAIGSAYGDRGDAIIAALSAGKHVIADKPICTDLQQLATIEKLCREKNRKLICMLDLRYLPQSVAALDLLQSGRLGQVRNVAFNGQHCIDYANRPSWYFEPGMHGGTINDLAIHGIDLVRMLTQMEFAKIDAARTWNAYADRTPEFRDCAMFMARLDNGAGVMADISYSAPSQAFSLPSYWEFRIWCDKGMLVFNYKDPKVTVFEEGTEDAIVINCDPVDCSYLKDLYEEITNDTFACTQSTMISTRTALDLQVFADREVM